MKRADLDKLLHRQWMSIAEEERFLVAARLYEAEKALLERLAPPGCSWVEIREFVYYRMYGEEMPEGAASRLERHDMDLGRS